MQVQAIELQKRIDRFQELCRTRGVRLTPQRLEVFRAVAASSAHPDAEMVLRGVQKRFPNVSLDTVYRTLWMLNDLGLVGTLGRRDSVRFDAESRPHHHYVCRRCQRVWDLMEHNPTAFAPPGEATKLGTIQEVRLEVQGVCTDCEKTDKAKRPPSKAARTKTTRTPS
ncbi:MAG: transcriptional repressor [Deltaproteobacteria bacterium]|nr:transcriptional repressor [Deltaproteobacteria bacterium]